MRRCLKRTIRVAPLVLAMTACARGGDDVGQRASPPIRIDSSGQDPRVSRLPSVEQPPVVRPVPSGKDGARPALPQPRQLPALPSPEERPFTNLDAMIGPTPQGQAEELPAPSRSQLKLEAVEGVQPLLSLDEVLRSVELEYPLLLAALQERGIASGELLSASGPFNFEIGAKSYTRALGFYEFSYNDLFVEQPTWNAGNLLAGYKIGRGFFPVWFGELDTNKGGEFRASYEQSLWQGLAIDKRRADLFKAQIARRAAEPAIYKARIDFMRAAASSYWNWVAEGRKYIIAEQILQTAMKRDEQLRLRAEIEDLSPIDALDNRRIVYDRQGRLIASGRRFQDASIKLSLFYRDRNGVPTIPETKRLPSTFPLPEVPQADRLGADIALAQRNRPELRELALKRQSTNVSLQLAQNQTLPKLDGYTLASQDVGEEVALGNKSPFVLEAGLQGGVPLQRSAARGAVRANQAILAQLAAQIRWAEDRISTDVQSAMAALVAAHAQLEPARKAVQATYRVEVAEREKWRAGDSSLFIVNLRELATAEAASVEVDALANYFIAFADYLAALGLDGLNYRRAGGA